MLNSNHYRDQGRTQTTVWFVPVCLISVFGLPQSLALKPPTGWAGTLRQKKTVQINFISQILYLEAWSFCASFAASQTWNLGKNLTSLSLSFCTSPFFSHLSACTQYFHMVSDCTTSYLGLGLNFLGSISTVHPFGVWIEPLILRIISTLPLPFGHHFQTCLPVSMCHCRQTLSCVLLCICVSP